jgi:hypothetical protein
VSIDESSVKGIPGFVRVVSKGNYVAVVRDNRQWWATSMRLWLLPAPSSRPSTTCFQGHTAFGPAHAMADPVERSAHDLLERHEVVGAAQRRRAVPGHPARSRARRDPEALIRTLEGGILHSLSRALHEEVKFDGSKITSVDWNSSPTLTPADVPEQIDMVLVNGDPNPSRPDLPHYGAGETVCKPTLAAVANALFDATGVRLRRVPLTPARVLAALRT